MKCVIHRPQPGVRDLQDPVGHGLPGKIQPLPLAGMGFSATCSPSGPPGVALRTHQIAAFLQDQAAPEAIGSGALVKSAVPAESGVARSRRHLIPRYIDKAIFIRNSLIYSSRWLSPNAS